MEKKTQEFFLIKKKDPSMRKENPLVKAHKREGGGEKPYKEG